jgi:hypothetical protein
VKPLVRERRRANSVVSAVGRLVRAGPFLLLLLGCDHAPDQRAPATPAAATPVYDYVALDGQRVSSVTNRGKVTIITIIATYDLASQVVVRELSEVRARQRRPLSVLAVVLEAPKNAPLAEAFAATMELPFPIAMADQATLEASGPFGRVDAVPTTIVLSAQGREVWRHLGAVLAADIERAIAAARRDV